MEVVRYKELVEKRREEEQQGRNSKGRDETEERSRRLAKKKRMEGYWERLRWVTRFLEETNTVQTDLKKMGKKDKEGEEQKKTWEEKTEEQKIMMLREESGLGRNDEEEKTGTKEERYSRGGNSENPRQIKCIFDPCHLPSAFRHPHPPLMRFLT